MKRDLKVNGYTFRGRNSAILPSGMGVKSEKKEFCSSGSKFFVLRVDPFKKGFH